MFSVKAPASSANLGPGFDCLGIALNLHNITYVGSSDSNSFIVGGEGSPLLPTNEDNLWYKSFETFFQEIKSPPPKIHVRQINHIPLGKGLGSSSAAIVSGLIAANEISGTKLSREKILELASKIEGHPDNVAAALYGGLTVAYNTNDGIKAKTFPVSNNISFLLLVPENKFLTKEARSVLPKNIPVSDVIFNISRTALLVGGLLRGDFKILAEAVEDRLHQPYRLPLIPDFDKVLPALKSLGIDSVALSGAGPSIICFLKKEQTATISEKLGDLLSELGVSYKPEFLEIDNTGAQIEPAPTT